MTSFRKITTPILLALLFCGNVWAIDLSTAKGKGLVGETPSGYLQAVGSPAGDISQLVTRINSERRALYNKVAKSNGTSLKNVEALAGQKAINEARAGHYVLVNGSWRKK